MKRNSGAEEVWETPSLEWIHRVRRQRQEERKGRPPRPLTREEAEALARKHGLGLARPAAAEK